MKHFKAVSMTHFHLICKPHLPEEQSFSNVNSEEVKTSLSSEKIYYILLKMKWYLEIISVDFKSIKIFI